MSNEQIHATQALLALKSKAANGIAWTAEEDAKIKRWLDENGHVSVLAACCVLASERPQAYPKSLGIVREAIGRRHLPSYVELSVYEALIYVEALQLESFVDEILPFIGESLAKRTIDLDNTICLLGKLARAGESRALALLRSLAHDNDPGIRDNVALVLQGIEPG